MKNVKPILQTANYKLCATNYLSLKSRMAMTVMMIKRTVTRVKEMVRLKTRPMKPSTAGARRMPM